MPGHNTGPGSGIGGSAPGGNVTGGGGNVTGGGGNVTIGGGGVGSGGSNTPYVPPPPTLLTVVQPEAPPMQYASRYANASTANRAPVKTSIIADQYARMLNVPFFQAFGDVDANSNSIFDRKNLLTGYSKSPFDSYTADARQDIEDSRKQSDVQSRALQQSLGTEYNATTGDTNDVLKKMYPTPIDYGSSFSIPDLLQFRGPDVTKRNIKGNTFGNEGSMDRNYSTVNYDLTGPRGGLKELYADMLAKGGRVGMNDGGNPSSEDGGKTNYYTMGQPVTEEEYNMQSDYMGLNPQGMDLFKAFRLDNPNVDERVILDALKKQGYNAEVDMYKGGRVGYAPGGQVAATNPNAALMNFLNNIASSNESFMSKARSAKSASDYALAQRYGQVAETGTSDPIDDMLKMIITPKVEPKDVSFEEKYGGINPTYTQPLSYGNRTPASHGGMMIVDNGVVNNGIGSILKKYNKIRKEL